MSFLDATTPAADATIPTAPFTRPLPAWMRDAAYETIKKHDALDLLAMLGIDSIPYEETE